MNIKDFQKQRKETLTSEYYELKTSNNQDECFEILAKKHDLSAHTVRQIIFNPKYPQINKKNVA